MHSTLIKIIKDATVRTELFVLSIDEINKANGLN